MDAAPAVPVALRRNREYVRYRAGRVISVLGSQLSGLALPLLVLALGGSALQVGVLGTCGLLVRLGSQLPAGYLADRFRRRTLMVGADLIRMIGYGSIPLAAALGRPSYPQLLAIAVLDGVGAIVFSTAATSALRDLVPAEQIPRAISQTQATMGTMALIGPVLGGLCFAVSRMLPFTLDAGSYLLSAVLLAGLAARPPASARPAASAGPAGGTGRRAGGQLSAGLRWLWHQPGIVRLVVFCAVFNLAGAVVQLTAVVGLRERGTSSAAIGIVVACSGAGIVTGAAVGRRVVAWLGPVRLYLTYGTIWTAGLAACAMHPSAPVVGLALALMFLLAPATGIALAQATLGQAPHELLGRVTSASQLLAGGLAALGPILSGVGLRALGAPPVWALLGVLCLLTTLVTMLPLATAGLRRGTDRTPQPTTAAREAGG